MCFFILGYLLVVYKTHSNLKLKERKTVIFCTGSVGSIITFSIGFMHVKWQYMLYSVMEGFKFTLLFLVFEYYTYKASKLLPNRKKLLHISKIFYLINMSMITFFLVAGFIIFPQIVKQDETGLNDVPFLVYASIMVFFFMPLVLTGFFYVVLNIILYQIEKQPHDMQLLVK